MSVRALTSRQAAKLLLSKKAALGISRLADLSQFIDFRISVIQAVRTTLIKGQVSATTGKGWSINDALCGALCEALERYCAANMFDSGKKYSGVLNLVSMEGFGHPSDFVPEDLFLAKDLISGENWLLPKIEVYFPYYGPDINKTKIHPHTSGLASGADLIEATLFGILEVVERNASSTFFRDFRTFSTGALVDIESITDEKICASLNEIKQRGYEILIFRINAVFPTYYAAILDTSSLGPKFMVSGVSCNTCELNALDGALLEAIQALVISTQGTREDLIRFSELYRTQKIGRNNHFYRIKEILTDLNPTINFPNIELLNHNRNADGVLHDVLQALINKGITKVYLCDLSQPQFPLKVVKIIIPGMFDLHINPLRGQHAVSDS